MIVKTPASEAEVIACWLQAELYSRRFAQAIRKALHTALQPKSIITEPDLANAKDNKLRKHILHLARGNVIRQFPWSKVKWYRASIESRHELGGLYTPFGDSWLAFTDGRRLLAKAAEFIAGIPATHDPYCNVLAIQDQLKQGCSIELPILITDRIDDRPFNILEGNVRLVAYYLYAGMQYPINCYVGVSAKLASWGRALDTLQDIRDSFIKGEHA